MNVLLVGDKLRLLIRLLLEYYWSLDRLIPHKLPLPSLNIVARWLLNLLLNLRSTLLASVPLSKALPFQKVTVRLRRSCTRCRSLRLRVWGTHQLLLVRISNIGDDVTMSLRRLGGLLLAKLPIILLLKGTIIPLVRRL